jgi:hypothetical protein
MSKLSPATADDYLGSKKRSIFSSSKNQIIKNRYFSINDSKAVTNSAKINFYQEKINDSLENLDKNTDYYLTKITYYLSKLYSKEDLKKPLKYSDYVIIVLNKICEKGLYELFKEEFIQIGDKKRYDYDSLIPESCGKTNTLSEVPLSSSSNSGNNSGIYMTKMSSNKSQNKSQNPNIRPNTSSQSTIMSQSVSPSVVSMFNNQIKDDIMRFSNVHGIKFRFDNQKQLITLCIDNDKYIDVLHIFDIKAINGSNKRIYDWKNNFSLEFLNKIFSLQSEVAYSLLHFYYLLLEYNTDIKNKYNELELHEYIYFIMNSQIINSNFIKNIKNIKNQNKIESIFESIINKNIFSTDFLKKNKSVFYDFCYSYDYFIQTRLIDSRTLNNNNKSKINIEKLEGVVTLDISRLRDKYFIDGISYKENYLKNLSNHNVSNHNDSIFFIKIKNLVKKFIEDNKNIEQTFNDIYIKILQSLYQALWSFSTLFFMKFLNNISNGKTVTISDIKPEHIKYIGQEKFNNFEEKKYVKISYVNNNIIIDSNICLLAYFQEEDKDKGEDKIKIFLFIIINVKIDILNNKICFKHSFEWFDENTRKMFLRNMKFKKMKNKRLAIINFDENNSEYNEYNYSKYVSDIEINPPLFVLVSTQNSTTKFKKGESVSFQHIMKEKLEKMGYSYRIKGKNIKDYDYGLKKISGKPVDRLRLYKRNNISNNNINNIGIDILQKKMLSNGTLCIKLKFKDNGVEKKYIFLNTNLLQQNNTSKTFEYIFDLLTTDNSFFQGNNRKTQNLIDLFHQGYSIYFLGNIDLTFLNNIIGNVIKKNNKNVYRCSDNGKNICKFYIILVYLVNEYFNKIGNSIMNKNKKQKNDLKKPSMMNSREIKENYLKKYNTMKETIKTKYRGKIFDFFINTTLDGNNIFYTSLNKTVNSNIVNIL